MNNREPLYVTLNNHPESCNLCRIGLLADYTDSCKLCAIDHFVILVVKQGKMLTQLGEKRIEYKKGDVCVIMPDTAFQFEYPEPNAEVYCLDFTKEFLYYDSEGESIKDRFLTFLLVNMALEPNKEAIFKVDLSSHDQELVVKLTEQFHWEFHKRREGMFDILHSILMTIINILGWHFLHETKTLIKEQKYRRINHLMTESVRYINNHYQEPITIKDITKEFGTSKTIYCTLFKQTMGTTFHAYLNNLRCEKVAQLLVDTDYSLEQICEMTGFADISSLYRNFTGHFGKSPGKYRKEYTSP